MAPPQGPQIPDALPSGAMHLPPLQQSASTVQPPQLATQAVEPQTYGGVPLGFGTQGRPLQQSALEAHDCPAPTQATPVQRGTPTLSVLHVSMLLQLPAQQSQDALHDIVESLQTSPFGLHPIGLRHTPTKLPAAMEQVTGLPEPPGSPAEPQQSEFFAQTSPTTWQPLAGWQTGTPVGP